MRKGREKKVERKTRAIAAASARVVKTSDCELRLSKGVLFVHQNVMYSLKYNYFLFHIRIEITFMFLFGGLRSEHWVGLVCRQSDASWSVADLISAMLTGQIGGRMGFGTG